MRKSALFAVPAILLIASLSFGSAPTIQQCRITEERSTASCCDDYGRAERDRHWQQCPKKDLDCWLDGIETGNDARRQCMEASAPFKASLREHIEVGARQFVAAVWPRAGYSCEDLGRADFRLRVGGQAVPFAIDLAAAGLAVPSSEPIEYSTIRLPCGGELPTESRAERPVCILLLTTEASRGEAKLVDRSQRFIVQAR